ncbi:hypothetical protein B296_00029429 [Ensete ventricosum]|uniref:Uncharacterized protein n=1 Tax=Ensete ventricosum TaxID=4639 RepID=A0A426YHZ7_ENSVE|nr:hypothetical protein B296_00029429 [Ensete ventricosum]
MRLIGEISYLRNEEDKENEGVPPMSLPPPPQQTLVVGFALTSKKVKSFFQPKLEALARKKGIVFVAIDQSRLLLDQGPFDIILHKVSWSTLTLGSSFDGLPRITSLRMTLMLILLTGKEWQQVLENYHFQFPGRVGTPRQLVITKDSSSIQDAVSKAGLALPLGGVLFKVYIVGEAIKVVRRFSLPDVSKRELLSSTGVFQFPRVSCAAASADDADLDPNIAVQQVAVPHHSSPVAGASSTFFAAACSSSGTRVQSGGRTGRGGYAVGPFRLTSQGCVFLGLVFMWCAVAFFCGRDEHSTPIHPPGDAGYEVLGLPLLVHDMGTAYANIPVIDAIVSLSRLLSAFAGDWCDELNRG